MATERPSNTTGQDALHQPPRIIAMINQKGGVGKTTTTVNLAAALARKGRRVLIVDLDPQAHASLHLGIEPEPGSASLYDLLLDPQMDPAEALIEAREGLFVLPSDTDLAAAEGELSALPDRHTRLARVLGRLHDRIEYVLIDCPPSLGMLTINALVAAGDVIIPMQAQFLALQGVGKLLETITLVTQNLNPSLRVAGVVLCMFDGKTTHAQEVVADLEAFFSEQRDEASPWRYARVYQPPIRRNVKVAECPSFGQSIFEYAPTAAGAQDYARLADELIREWEAWTRDRRPPRAQLVQEEPEAAIADTEGANEVPSSADADPAALIAEIVAETASAARAEVVRGPSRQTDPPPTQRAEATPNNEPPVVEVRPSEPSRH